MRASRAQKRKPKSVRKCILYIKLSIFFLYTYKYIIQRIYFTHCDHWYFLVFQPIEFLFYHLSIWLSTVFLSMHRYIHTLVLIYFLYSELCVWTQMPYKLLTQFTSILVKKKKSNKLFNLCEEFYRLYLDRIIGAINT